MDWCLGVFYESNQGAALDNPSFRPFTAPVPFRLIRHAVVSDWKFFLDKEDWLDAWARRHGHSAVHARNRAACRGARDATNPGPYCMSMGLRVRSVPGYRSALWSGDMASCRVNKCTWLRRSSALAVRGEAREVRRQIDEPHRD